MTWNRSDVKLGNLFARGDLVYRALIDDPVVVLVPASYRDGEEREHYVIGSPLFAEFRRVEYRTAAGAVEVPQHEDGP